jgi:hypothetical protein
MSDDVNLGTVGPSPAPSAALALAAASREDVTVRDRFIALAAATGDSVAAIADHLELSRQQIHAILDKERQAPPLDASMPALGERALAWRATEEALESISGGEAFERLVQVLLHDIDPRVRPLGGTGDRARDAIADLGDGDGSIFSISIERQWTRKIRREVKRVLDHGHRPRFVYAITNRKTTRQAEDKLEQWAADMGITLRVLGQRWLVVKLLHPSYLHIREQMLGLAPPRPTVFRDAEEYRQLLNGRRSTLGLDLPRVGSDELPARVRDRLDKTGCVVLTGPGGTGKTRLMLDLAEQSGDWERWRFLDDLTPVNDYALGQLGSGYQLVVVVDNAHRRNDLSRVLALLERRQPKPKVVFIARPHRVDVIESAAASVWLGPLTHDDQVVIRGLSTPDLIALVKGPPFGLRYDGMIRAVVRLAEGNPLIAILAAQLARDGQSIAELSRASVFEAHVSSVLGALTEASAEPRQLREVLAIVAALGSINSHDTDLIDRVARLVGFGPKAVNGWLAELSDLGLTVETADGVYAIKPDLLAEHVLASSFFSTRWRTQLCYEEVLEELPSCLRDLSAAIGRLPPGLLDPTHAGVRAFHRRVRSHVTAGSISQSAELIKQALPGAEDLLLDDLAELVGRLERAPEDLSLEVVKPLVAATQRISQAQNLHLSWQLLMRIASITIGSDVLGEVRTTMHAIYQRVPTDSSAQDGVILSIVQQAIAQATRSYARRANGRGQRRAVAMAGQALLTVTFEHTSQSLESARQLDMRAYALPANADLRSVLDVGIDALVDTFADVGDQECLRGLESATELARRAAGFAGPFGLQLDDKARDIAHSALEKLDAYLHASIERLSMPLQAETSAYLLLRRDWLSHSPEPQPNDRKRPTTPLRSPKLREYLLLIHPNDVEPPSAHYSWDEEQQREQAESAELARSLADEESWQERLERWRSWLQDAAALYEKATPRTALSRVFAELTVIDPERTITVIDYLIETSSPLRAALPVALCRLVASNAVGEATLTTWLDHDEDTRALAAVAIAEVDSELAVKLFRRLARDLSEKVRRAALNGLRYGTTTADWKIRLGLEIARDLKDLDALHSVLLVAENAHLSPTPESLAIAREAFLASAEVERVNEFQLLETLRQLDADKHELLFAWIWQRIEWLQHQNARAWMLDTLPAGLAPLVRDRGSSEELEEAMRRFAESDGTNLADEALVDLLEWLDPGAWVLTDYIVDNYEEPDRHQKVWRLLRLELSWKERRTRAAALASRLEDADVVVHLIINALPDMWSGSRVPHLESAIRELDRWKIDESQPTLRTGIAEARRHLERMIERERERDRRDDELMRWA